MRVLVTGGAGFIGSHLCERLLARGERVVVLDDLSTGRAANLDAVADHPALELVIGSVTDEAAVDDLVRGCDLVVHLAAAVGVRLVLEQPVRTVETNARGTELVLRSAARHGAKVCYASTSEVYGKSERLPYHEDDPVLLGATAEPRWSYACSKAMGEWLALAHARTSGLRAVVVRLFNTVGPRQSPETGMVLPTLARQAVAGEPLTIYGDGRQTRSFAHVADVVEACLSLCAEPAAEGRVVNVGAAHEIAIAELAELVRRVAGSRSPIVHMPYREAYGTDFRDFPRRVPDLRRLARLTGFRARTSLEAVVADVVAEARARTAAPVRCPRA
jgi:UDP-glucose 4-epimerase